MFRAVNWEKALLGTVLHDHQSMEAVEDLHPSDFSGSHQEVWAELQTLHRNGPFDARALIERLRSHDSLSDIGRDLDSPLGGEAYILSLLELRGNIEPLRKQVEDAAIKRSMHTTGALISADALSDRPAEELLDEAEQRVIGIRRNRGQGGVMLGSLLNQYGKRMLDMRAGRYMPAWTPKLNVLTELIGYVDQTEFVTVAARPGEGKSSFIRYEALEMARSGQDVLIFNLENDEFEYAKFAMAAEANIDSEELKNPGRLNQEKLERAQQAIRTLESLPLHIVTLGSPDVFEVMRIARQYVAEHDIKLIMVDYVQLVQNGFQNRVQDVSRTTQELRGFALKNKVPMLIASQLSRNIEHRGESSHPQLSDLRESGCLTGESLIQLANGQRVPIAELVGQKPEVIALDKNYRLVNQTARKVWLTGHRPVFRMRTSLGNEICATGNHQFLTADGWQALDDLKAGDYIAQPRQLPSGGELLNPDQAALLGHLIGDGCTLDSHAIQYTTNEIELTEMVCRLAKGLWPTLQPYHKQERNWQQVYFPGQSPSPIKAWLQSLGIWNLRSAEKHVPQQIWNSDLASTATFLRHLWTTDGCVGVFGQLKPRPLAYYASSSQRLAHDVQQLLLRLGVPSRIRRTRDMWNVTVTSKPNLLKFAHIVGAVGAKQIGLKRVLDYLITHQHNPNADVVPASVWRSVIVPQLSERDISTRGFHELMGWSYSGTQRYKFNLSRENAGAIAAKIQSTLLADLATSEITWVKIIAIEACGTADVYDMEVPDQHNFIANGIVAHNSIEQDSTQVWFLRDVWTSANANYGLFPENLDHQGNRLPGIKSKPIRVHVAKNRNGPKGITDPVKWNMATGRFYPLQRDVLNVEGD